MNEYARLGARLWTDEEEAFLKQNYATMSTEELAKHLGRPKCTIQARASILGCYKRIRCIEHINEIKQLAKTHYCKQVAQIIGVDERTLSLFAKRNNIKFITRHAATD